jgi:hypothetical protein
MRPFRVLFPVSKNANSEQLFQKGTQEYFHSFSNIKGPLVSRTSESSPSWATPDAGVRAIGWAFGPTLLWALSALFPLSPPALEPTSDAATECPATECPAT